MSASDKLKNLPSRLVPAALPGVVTLSLAALVALVALLAGLGFGIGYAITVRVTGAQEASIAKTSAAGSKPIVVALGSTSLPPELELRYQLLKNRLDDAAENSKRINDSVTLLLALTSLYAVVLGLSSYFGLSQILESGKQDLKRMDDDFKQAKDDLRERYPELADLAKRLREIIYQTDGLFPTRQSWAVLFAKQLPREREEIEVAEMRIAGLEVFRLGELKSHREKVRRIYQGLGRYYGSKYLYYGSKDENKGKTGDERKEVESDWERAGLYFTRAEELCPAERPADLMKDRGLYLTLIEQVLDVHVAGGYTATAKENEAVTTLRKQAERAYLDSLKNDPSLPGALTGLAWVHYKNKNYREAIKQLEPLTSRPRAEWTPGDREVYLDDAYFNQACFYSMLAAAEQAGADQNYTKALELLRKSRGIAVEYGRIDKWKDKVRNEAKTGDLIRLEAARGSEFGELVN